MKMHSYKQSRLSNFKRFDDVADQSLLQRIASLSRTGVGQSVLGSVLLCLSSLIKVPLQPVPMTLQSLAVFYLALILSPLNAVRAVLLYIAWGVAGLPVLARGGGLQAVLYPGGGFILGLVGAAGVISTLMSWQSRAGWTKRFVFVILGQVCLYTLGVLVLCRTICWKDALRAGVLPFLSTIPIKAALAVALSQCSPSLRTLR